MQWREYKGPAWYAMSRRPGSSSRDMRVRRRGIVWHAIGTEGKGWRLWACHGHEDFGMFATLDDAADHVRTWQGVV